MHHPPTTTTSSFRSLPSFINQLNDTTTVGNEICGLLYKWVNYARGWRPRWFILHDGVLSYYNREIVHSASKVIGFRRIDAATHSDSTLTHRKPLGQVHLMVCSVREHKSNEKRFCVYTGMKKRLHLRAETKEDRDTWVEAMLSVKDVFPRTSNSIAESISEAESMVISTHRLRQRLLEEGVSEATIQESENIMRSEISHVLSHNHFNLNLIDTTERVDQVESQRQHYLKDDGESFISMLENDSEGSASDSTHENNHDAFFDTCDILSTCSGRSNGSHQYQRSCIDFECGESSTNGEYEGKSFNGSNYPHVRRRKKLPDPVEKEKGVSLWSIIKDNIGKDLTNICLPVYFNEPISSLQKCFEDLEYSYLLDQAYACGKMGNSLMRMLHVAAFAVSGYACTDKRSCKPFNPLLGETYEADYPDKGIRFISEKVSHHPMILACHCEGKGWKFWGDSNLKSKFWGRSIHIDPVGVLTLEFDDGEVFRWSKVSTAIYNLILGKIYCDHYGTMRIEGNREYSCKIKFKEQSIIDKNPHQVHGVVEDTKGKVVASLCGNWDESLHYTIIENSGKGKRSNVSSKARQLWKRSEPSDYPTRYNLTQFAITLNEITPILREKLPPTDSRLRPDQRCLENGEYEKANAEKLHLEQRQRQARKIQEKGWKPRWFAMDKDSHTYCYVGGYWEAREKGNWESCSDIFGQLPTETDTDFDPTN
ncbi:oxysterol-binding protein-related protein 1B-like [Gastrolobium bilobum]|uniref:oxysterol-binding protein-related protein 1B-like n=1 Tax=Gastrolobium bilobum TaxID=150636 RepID=UPI002AB11678|nr:oxysterol-binding protein-related protein 1B-like [Gastrolobium bilobum]